MMQYLSAVPMSDQIILSEKEQRKFQVISQTLENKITNGLAEKLLDISPRQVKRLKQDVRRHGKTGIVHKLKGRKSNHAIAAIVKEVVLETISKNYYDFKPGFATEKLHELHGVTITSQTIRVWMSEKGL